MTSHRPAGTGFDAMTRVQFLPGVGPLRAQAFERLGIVSMEQLLRHYPRTWLDARTFVTVRELQPGKLLTVRGEVKHAMALRTRAGRSDFTCSVEDGTGSLGCYFFGQSFLTRTLRPGVQVVVSGELDPLERRMVNPMFEVVEGDLAELLHVGRLVPVHALTKGVTGRGMRAAVRHALDAVAGVIPDPLPAETREAHALLTIADALRHIHFPESDVQLAAARRRLAFEELFLMQSVLELRRRVLQSESRGIALPPPGPRTRALREGLPWPLTDGQREALADIAADLARPRPMHRIVLGDVGSGKTIVALIAASQAIEAGHTAAFMAPTEILARQHAASMSRFARLAGFDVLCLTSATPAAERRTLQARLAAGDALLVVGTHALLEDRVAMPNLALAIVDEQHRFGVRQRATLAKKSVMPHVLVMTATPIPRTLQLAWFGDLDRSEMRTRPPGRGRLVTRVTHEDQFPQVVEFMAKELAAGRQAFVVVPAIEESARAEMKAAETEVERLRSHPRLRSVRIEQLHGRMKADAKQAVMEAFAAGQVQVLVATTVVEVGLDVPNATLMVVENADRFGLTQLHQLRGRVGRGTERSVCVFVGGAQITARARERLAVMAKTDDGFELAEADLRLRGPGELWGVRQSGLPRLRVADLTRDEALLLETREAARRLLESDPHLLATGHQTMRESLRANYAEALALALSG